MSTSQNLTVNWKNVPTQTITAGGVEFAYRELGANNPGTPVVFLIHLAAVLDNWDPRVVDGFATSRRVIAFDNRGVGASSGAPATSIEQMATDAITFIKAMGFEQVDLFGFSMGQARTRSIWRAVFRIATSSSIPTPDTVRCSSSTRTSCPGRSSSSHVKYSSVRVCNRRAKWRSVCLRTVSHTALKPW
jgi:hypothetical protein